MSYRFSEVLKCHKAMFKGARSQFNELPCMLVREVKPTAHEPDTLGTQFCCSWVEPSNDVWNACVRACVRACVCKWVHVCVCVCGGGGGVDQYLFRQILLMQLQINH